MNSLFVAGIAFFCIFGGALFGLFIQRFLPEHHLSSESKDTVKLGAGLIATMAAEYSEPGEGTAAAGTEPWSLEEVR